MKVSESKKRTIFRQVQRQAVAQGAWIRRVERGPKDYASGTFTEQHLLFEAVLVEQKPPTGGQLPEVLPGVRRFVLALSGRAFLAGADWSQHAATKKLFKPLLSDRLWLNGESRELLLSQEPTNLDAGMGVLFEVIAR